MTPERIGIFTAALFATKPLKTFGILLVVAAFVGKFALVKIALLVYAILVIKTASDPEFGRLALAEADYVRGDRRELPQSGSEAALSGKYLELSRRAHKSLE